MAEWARTGAVDAAAVGQLPDWLAEVARTVPRITAYDLTRYLPPHGQGRHSAVLVLFGGDRELLLIRRSSTMRAHAGQPAFPGGAIDETDADVRAAALREAREETGLDPAGVLIFGTLPDVWIPVSGFVVTPVLGWWREPSIVAAQDPAEVASVHRVKITDLVDPANRVRVVHPAGYVGPGFTVDGLTIWGFTGNLIAGLIEVLGWAQPWDESRSIPVPLSTPDP